MKKFTQQICILGIVLPILCHYAASQEPAVEDTEILDGPDMSMEGVLNKLAKRANCRFTLEFTQDTDKKFWFVQTPPFEVKKTLTLDQVEAIVDKELLDGKDVTMIRYQPEKGLPVIHLIDNLLLGSENYNMNKRISLKFQGKLLDDPIVAGLSNQIDEQVGGFIAPNGGTFRDLNDFQTRVDISVENKTVREIITDCLPKDYYRILWRAVIVTREDKTITKVRFNGP